ncbi:MAG: B12-binding domain-containing radical SAM protein, partial [Methanosarcinaceae archaeon]|nr:B12-binding domain-containing radical SAM protein [Methanosarcinaceae archaeon]
ISALRDANHSVDFIDLYLKKQKLPDFENYDFVAISSNTICFRGTMELINEAKLAKMRGWSGKVIIGGPHTSVAPETIPDIVDHIIMGEGEKAIVDIVEGNETKRIVRAERIQNLDKLPLPAYDLFVDCGYDEKTWLIPKAKKVFSYSSSRGCPFNCTFCSSKNIWGRQYTYVSPEKMVEDLKGLQDNYRIDGVYFREDNFTVNKKRLQRLCELMKEKTPRLLWATESRVDTLTEPLLKLMHDAGCRGLYFGVEGGNQKMLDYYNKEISLRQIEDVFRWTRKLGMKTYASFIIDTPDETIEDRMDLVNLIEKIKPDFYNLNHFTALPGSELYEYSLQKKCYEYVDDVGLLIMPKKNYPGVSYKRKILKRLKKIQHFS